MIEFVSLFNGQLAEQIGWTLFHSLWQGLIIAGLAIALLRFIPNKLAAMRYNIAGTALLMIFLSAIGTFIYEFSGSNTKPIEALPVMLAFNHNAVQDGEMTLISTIQNFVVENKAIIVVVWLVGTLVFSIRLFGGWLYTIFLRAKATLLYNQWTNRMHDLRKVMGIDKMVALAESSSLDAPVVVGFFKPLVIVPAGMFSGLTPDEVETILLHELMHIKRSDYLLNIFQSIIETLLFFNPFVWLLSSIIRREREHSCDDGVIAYHGSPMAYAYALTRLEEIRVAGPSLALSAAGNRYELLNRIKRIMEKSAKKYSNIDRIVPVALLITGVILASFLTIGSIEENTLPEFATEKKGMLNIPALDTPRKKKKEASYYRKSETIVDENGEPKEIITEEFTGDDELRPLVDPQFSTHLDFDPALAFEFNQSILADFNIDPFIVDFPSMEIMDFNFELMSDTTTDKKRWKEFSMEFQRQFQERFKSFYKDHQAEFEAMMEQMESGFNEFNSYKYDDLHEAEEIKYHLELLRKQQGKLLDYQSEDLMKRQEENRLKMESELSQVHEQLRRAKTEMVKMKENMAAFEKELHEQLVKDGYLKKGAKLETMRWKEDGVFEVNGKRIKDADIEKYNKLRKKYFKGNFRTFYE